jgi:ankyrin repeat protein
MVPAKEATVVTSRATAFTKVTSHLIITELPGYEKNCIAQFLGAKDALYLATSCKDLYQTLSLSYVPPGIIFENPIQWTRNYYSKGTRPFMYHERIPLLFNNLRSVVVSLQWNNRINFTGDSKCQIYIIATPNQISKNVSSDNGRQKFKPNPQENEFGGRLVYASPFAPSTDSFVPLRFTFRPRPDETYYLWYKVGDDCILTLRDVRLETTVRPATMLHDACMFGGVEKVEWMLQHGGANSNITDSDGWTPLHEVIALNAHDATIIVRLLLKYGANPNATAKDGWTTLHEACRNGNEAIVDLLLGKKAHPNVTKQDGWTPLHEACEYGHDAVVELLLKHKANPNAADCDGISPLHVACEHGRLLTVTLLLKHGANVNATTKIGWTPLHEACCNDNEEITALLLTHGARPNAETLQWRTPLHEASKSGSRALVTLLLESNAIVMAVDKDEVTPTRVASMSQNAPVLHLLVNTLEHSAETLQESSTTTLQESRSANINRGPRWMERITNLSMGSIKALCSALPYTVTGLDKLLRDLTDRAGGMYTVYISDVDAMNDCLIAKALSAGISVEDITYAVFACRESRTFMHDFLLEHLLLSEMRLNNILELFYFKEWVDYRLFTDAILYFNDDYFQTIASNREPRGT